MTKQRILLVDDEVEILNMTAEFLNLEGYATDKAVNAIEAERFLLSTHYIAVISDIHMPGKSGLKLLEDMSHRLEDLPPFLFVSGNADPKVIETASLLGAADVIQKPFSAVDLVAAIKHLASRSDDKILDIMSMIHKISGITLTDDKRPLVETRLLRRLRQLQLQTIEEYFTYFRRNRDTEVPELVSLITTHTTHFFRESGHFDYLTDTFFPRMLAEGRKSIHIWSAASSSGEEAYSLAMCYLEFIRTKGLDPASAPVLKILGSDIDFNVVELARKGIYPKANTERLSVSITSRYFDHGSGELTGFVRVKDSVHKMCEFRQVNLIGKSYPSEVFDAIFLRNVLIYFKPVIVKQIIETIGQRLAPDGLLFLGHSESIAGSGTSLKSVGNSIYVPGSSRLAAAASSAASTPPSVRPPLSAVPKPGSGANDSVGSNAAAGAAGKKIRVFIIDDSTTIRTMLKRVFAADPGFEVVGEAENPLAIKAPLTPLIADVVTLDIHMPGQDGISYLRSIQGRDHPAVVMISSVNFEDGVDYMNCLELGASDYIEKPAGQNLADEGDRIRHVVRAAKRRVGSGIFGPVNRRAGPKGSGTSLYQPVQNRKDLIVIGASTGGVEALKTVIESFPSTCPPTVIVQHIPAHFSRTFADRLNQTCGLTVTEAVDGDILEPNHVYIAPGGKQLAIIEQGARLAISISDGPPVNRHKPSVDFMFDSAVRLTRRYTISAAILTGMGADGAKGLLALRQAGCHTVAQNEETCVVFGMPKVAIELGGAVEVAPLPSVSYHLFKAFNRGSAESVA